MQNIETVEELERLLGIGLSSYDTEQFPHAGIRLSRAGGNIAHAIRTGDAEAARAGHLLLVIDPRLPFGKLIKSEIARALKQRVDLLTDTQRASLMSKTVELLSLEFCPREVEDYCRVIKKFGSVAIQSVVDSTCATNEKSRRLISQMHESTSSKIPSLAEHRAQMKPQTESAGEFIRKLRESDRY